MENNLTDSDNNGLNTVGRDSLGRFGMNNPGKPKGAKSKLREKLKGFIETNMEDLQAYFDELDSKDKIKVLTDLLPFVVAKLQGVSTVDAEGNDVEPKVSIDYSKLSPELLHELLKNVNTIQDETETN